VKVLIDTNIVIDNLARRDEYGESLLIHNLCESGSLEGVVTTVTIMDVMYIMRKHLGIAETRNAVQILLQIVDVVPALKGDINIALTGDFPDFEDAVQASCASRVKADYIVTRNVKDFEKSSVPAITPDDMLKLIDKTKQE
jgi:predicted nucleic acid-binding protein